MMSLPNPAFVTFKMVEIEEVTEDVETSTWNELLANPRIGLTEDGTRLVWDEGDEVRGVSFKDLNPVGDGTFAGSDAVVLVRPVDPYDALSLAPSAGVPQPLEVVKAEILRGGGMVATELDALVAEDNTVATLMLDTGLGVYVRYAGDWQPISSTSDSLEDLAVVAVGSGAVDVYDAAEGARTTVSIEDLPIATSDDQGNLSMIDPTASVEGEVISDEVLTASGANIPIIATAEDIDLGITYGSTHPESRWYVAKRAKALGIQDRIPADWGVFRQLVAVDD
jgi:hypothetical protein